MIDRNHGLSVRRQAKALGISRGSVYYVPRPASEADLALMRRIDELHLEFPFAGDRAVLRTLCRQTTFSQSWIQARKNNKVEEQLLLDLVRLGFLE